MTVKQKGLRDVLRIGQLYTTPGDPTLANGEVEFHPHKRWARIGAGRFKLEAERLAMALAVVARNHWMDRGPIRARYHPDGSIDVAAPERVATALARLWDMTPGLSAPD